MNVTTASALGPMPPAGGEGGRKVVAAVGGLLFLNSFACRMCVAGALDLHGIEGSPAHGASCRQSAHGAQLLHFQLSERF